MNLNRRKFLTVATSASALSIVDHLSSFARPINKIAAPVDYKLLVLATNWGYNGTWDEFCARIKADGYDGGEAWYSWDAGDRKAFVDAFEKHNLKFGLLIGSGERDYVKHLKQFKDSLDAALELQPLYINCHSGRDHFTAEQNQAFIDATIKASERSGTPVYHETHRSRIMYSAPVTRQFLEKNPKLRLTLDISHWCCVHESLLEDQSETVSLALSRTGHIHARIGHPEGPQVNDPRAPEWKNAVDAHFGWWDKVISEKKKAGNIATMLTEFGPADYMPALPYSRQPVADQWSINKYMLNILRARYGS
jgi:sugar phosphate isomerase/epimerase